MGSSQARKFSVGASSRDIQLVASASPLKPASQELSDLLAAVQGVGSGTSLNQKVVAIQNSVAANDTPSACAAVLAFKKEVKAQSGRKIRPTTAMELQHAADRVAAAVGC